MLNLDKNSGVKDFTNAIEELQSKFEKVFEFVENLKKENETLREKVRLLEAEVETLRTENQILKANGGLLLTPEERENLKQKIGALIQKIEQYL